MEIAIDLVAVDNAVEGIAQPESIVADVAYIMLIYISIGKSGFNGIMG